LLGDTVAVKVSVSFTVRVVDVLLRLTPVTATVVFLGGSSLLLPPPLQATIASNSRNEKTAPPMFVNILFTALA
jgi:hypothetical protein